MKKTLLLFGATALLVNTASQAQTSITNSSMETWRNIVVATSPTLDLMAPDNWFGIDSLIAGVAPFAAIANVSITPQKMLYKSPDFYEGAFSAEVRTKKLGDSIGNIGGVVTNGIIGINLATAMGGDIGNAITYSGGTNVTGDVSKINAWVKTALANVDNSTIAVMAMKNSGDTGILVASGNMVVAANTNAFTNVEVPLTQIIPGESPDRIIVIFTSSDMSDSVKTEENTMYVDGVTYTMGSTGITRVISEANNVSVYPNPASGSVNFELNRNEKPENYELMIVDMNGRTLSTQQLNSQITKMDISNYASGIYFYNLRNVKNNKLENGKFIVK